MSNDNDSNLDDLIIITLSGKKYVLNNKLKCNILCYLRKNYSYLLSFSRTIQMKIDYGVGFLLCYLPSKLPPGDPKLIIHSNRKNDAFEILSN